ncbi:uromodulin-like isoform X1 [Esox lucius]|uniref:uromodulin-like isoform X1 n=1 Tax=Esox lucius TaxID=8010 RepID=UPI001476C748|nr:uromodulin-like isoform X1 [Esox lucius]
MFSFCNSFLLHKCGRVWSFITLIQHCFAGLAVTSCQMCHEKATCLVFPGEHQRGDAFTAQFRCTCQEGFVGDGLTCYDLKICAGGSCCRQGYRWSSELGCVDVDECSLPEPPCSPPQVCENTPGSFHCQGPPGDDLLSGPPSGPPSGPYNFQFQCGSTRCPVGEDCISVGGTSRCADPCQHYTALKEDWRSTTNNGQYNGFHSDQYVNWQGWYRLFLGNTSVQMPERCVGQDMCGTTNPLWLSSPHPQLGDGVVQGSICGNMYGTCCYYNQNPINVKACFGNYYVYKFVQPVYNSAYCADANSTVCASCGLFDACVENNNTGWRCVKKVPELVCGRSFLQVGLPKVYLEAAGLDPSSAHMADSRCSDNQDHNGVVWYQVELMKGRCGNTLKTNGTIAVYSNSLFVYPIDGRKDSQPFGFPFSCVYPLETESSLDVPIIPYSPSDHLVVGVGPKASASMSLYRQSNYTDPYPAGKLVTLLVGSTLHVGVSVQESDAKTFVVILEDCYTTESPSYDALPRTYLIQDRCPRAQVTVEESGSSLRASFSARLPGNQVYVFVHCSLSLCDKTTFPCSPVCSRRRSRSVSSSTPLKPLTIGPITWVQRLE